MYKNSDTQFAYNWELNGMCLEIRRKSILYLHSRYWCIQTMTR